MWFLATRYLLSRKRQTLLILLGIILGTGAYVTISGLMLGFQEFLLEQLVNNDAHIRISAREEEILPRSLDHEFFPTSPAIAWLVPPSGRRDNAKIEYPQGWYDKLDHEPSIVAYSPQLALQIIARHGKITQAGKLIGSNPFRQIATTNISTYMTRGDFTELGRSGNRLIVGEDFLKQVGTTIGDTLQISAGKGAPAPFKIIGAYRTGIKQLDESTVFGALADAQQLNQTPSALSDIAVRITDYRAAKPIATAWQTSSHDRVQSWDQINTGTLSIFHTQDFIRNFMTLSLLAVAGFGIYNVLNMLIQQKRGEIAILRSIGYEARDIHALFFLQGAVLGTIGGVIGLALGFGICLFLRTIQVDPGRINFGGRMLVSFSVWIYIRGILQALGAATVASLLPARAAAKLTPVEILRAEGG